MSEIRRAYRAGTGTPIRQDPPIVRAYRSIAFRIPECNTAPTSELSRRVRQANATFIHHRDEVSKAQLENTNSRIGLNLLVNVSALEQLFGGYELRHLFI
jgi:hypothetical protein